MDTMRLYCEVARHQSFSKAAAALGLTQSAISQRIGALEKELDIVLFDRSVRPLALTPQGEVFLKEAKMLVDRYDKLVHKVTQMQTLPQIPSRASDQDDLSNQLPQIKKYYH